MKYTRKLFVFLLFLVALYLSYTPFKISLETVYAKKLSKNFKWLTYQISGLLIKNGKMNDISPILLAAVIEAESRGKTYAKGKWIRVRICIKKCYRKKTRALGLMQIIPEFHWRGKKARLLFCPSINIRVGAKILKAYRIKAKGSIHDTLKNYNSGPHSKHYNWPYIRAIVARTKKVAKGFGFRYYPKTKK